MSSLHAEMAVAGLAVMCAIARGGDDLKVHPCDGCSRTCMAGAGRTRCPACRKHTLTVGRTDAGLVTLACEHCSEWGIRRALAGLGMPDAGIAWQDRPGPDWSRARFVDGRASAAGPVDWSKAKFMPAPL